MKLPDGEHSVEEMTERIDAATARLIASASALSDGQAREPSPLPGWSRGHVLTHVARNADGLRNLLIWAQTGQERPQYPSQEARDAAIEAGSGRPAAELTEDIATSAAAFLSQARQLDDDAWRAEIHGLRGPGHPAWQTLRRRLFEVEVHHVDLAAGYLPSDWQGWFVTEHLARVSDNLAAGGDGPAAIVSDPATGDRYDLRPDWHSKVLVTGPGYELLAWLVGRSSGNGLSTDPPGPLPAVPAY